MTEIVIQGIGGRMGHVLCDMIAQREDCCVVAGIDMKDGEQNGIPVYDSLEKLNGKGEVYLSVKDKARDIAAFKSELSALDLTLSDTFADINGGFILKYGDIQINGELSALIHEKRDVLTDELNKALFN